MIEIMFGLQGSGRRGCHAVATATPVILLPRPWGSAGLAPGRGARTRLGAPGRLGAAGAGTTSITC
jgi:hypothetical protein